MSNGSVGKGVDTIDDGNVGGVLRLFSTPVQSGLPGDRTMNEYETTFVNMSDSHVLWLSALQRRLEDRAVAAKEQPAEGQAGLRWPGNGQPSRLPVQSPASCAVGEHRGRGHWFDHR